jgi:lantibiotic modifying enzyme
METLQYGQNGSKHNNKISQISNILYNSPNKYLSLFNGKAGDSLFHMYHSFEYRNDDHNQKAIGLISEIFESVSKGFSNHLFAGGLAGIGWLIEFLEQNEFLEADTNEIIGELDEYLSPLMIKEIKSGNFDYLHGAGGIALYLLKRMKKK